MVAVNEKPPANRRRLLVKNGTQWSKKYIFSGAHTGKPQNMAHNLGMKLLIFPKSTNYFLPFLPRNPHEYMAFRYLDTVHVPLDGLHPNAPYGGDYVVVIFPVGRAEQRGPHAAHRLNGVAACRHVRHNLVGGELVVVVVMGAVTHHLMPRLMQRHHRLRVLLHPVPHHKKRGLNIVSGQNINQRLRVLIPPR